MDRRGYDEGYGDKEMRVIKSTSIGRAHENVVRLITREHIELVTEDGELTWEYPEPVCIHITHGGNEPKVSKCSLFGERFLEEYVKKVCEITPRRNDGTDATYTYGNRLRDYPVYDNPNNCEPEWYGNGSGDGIDQIEHIILQLKGVPQTRRAIVHTWSVDLDQQSTEPPCLQTIQFMIRNRSLNMYAHFRSNDMLSAWGPNAYALWHLQRLVAQGVKVSVGYIETVSTSAHIYPKRDAQELERFKI